MTRNEMLVDMNKKTRSLFVTPWVRSLLPDIIPAFEAVDQRYLESPRRFLDEISDSIFVFKSLAGGTEVTCSLLYDDRSKNDEILLIFAPFSDVEPKSPAKELYRYIHLDNPDILDKQKAKPNGWNQATKSKVVFELIAALGQGMPVLTIFSPVPPAAYFGKERKAFRSGDFSPATRIATEALFHAQTLLHGSNGETQVDKLHTYGASLGASNNVGASRGLAETSDRHQVLTVTAQELIMGPQSLVQLADGFLFRNTVGDPPSLGPLSRLHPRILEPALRRAIDAHGNELTMFPRIINAMLKLSYLSGLTHPRKIAGDVENLLDRGIPVTVAVAKNSRLTHQTPSYLPQSEENLRLITVTGHDQRVGHLIDEHTALTAAVIALGIQKARKKSVETARIRSSEPIH